MNKNLWFKNTQEGRPFPSGKNPLCPKGQRESVVAFSLGIHKGNIFFPPEKFMGHSLNQNWKKCFSFFPGNLETGKSLQVTRSTFQKIQYTIFFPWKPFFPLYRFFSRVEKKYQPFFNFYGFFSSCRFFYGNQWALQMPTDASNASLEKHPAVKFQLFYLKIHFLLLIQLIQIFKYHLSLPISPTQVVLGT